MAGLPPPRIDLLIYSPSSAAFVPVLATLLEPSPALSTLLAPQLHAELQRRQAAAEPLPKTYAELLAISARLVDTWDVVDQAAFLSAHPRIGETKNLSALSGVEQGGKSNDETPGEVLKRLSMLNASYEKAFPGLRYTTFVNGRARADIIPEMEGILGIALPAPSTQTGEPRLAAVNEQAQVRVMGSQAWRVELKRGLGDLWAIAANRLEKLGIK